MKPHPNSVQKGNEKCILLADDQDEDVFFLRRALAKAALPNPLIVARDGQEAVDYLHGEGPFANRQHHPLPSLLLLDVKMPRLTGFEVLAWVRAHSGFKDLPVVMLSGSDLPADLKKARALGAQDYLVKPSGTEKLASMLLALHNRWLNGIQPAALTPLEFCQTLIY